MKKLALACAVGVVAWASGAQAWHSGGHMMVAAYAWPKMKPGVRCAAAKLLNIDETYAKLGKPVTDADGVDPGQALFIHAATWPDRIKSDDTSAFHKDSDMAPPKGSSAGKYADVNNGLAGSGNTLPRNTHSYWHFVDYPVPADANHPPQWANAEERIVGLAADLKSSSTTNDQKAYALAWLIHLVGDVHQPLHTSEQWSGAFAAKGDAGGNGVLVCPQNAPSCAKTDLCPDPKKRCGVGNLHSYWDALPGESDSVNIAIKAAMKLTAPSAADAAITKVSTWVSKSHELATTTVYVAPIVLGSEDGFKLTPEYKSNAKRVAMAQVPLAGARLANLLNASLKPDNSCPQYR